MRGQGGLVSKVEHAKDGLGLTLRLTGLGLVIGLLASGAATLFVAVEHQLMHLLWDALPEALGVPAPPWWLVIGLPTLGAGLTLLAMKLPGGGGHSPLAGLKLSIELESLASVLAASLAALCFGAVLGPEAPLMAIGTAIGAAVFRREASETKPAMMLVGAMAAIGVVLGSPLITAILVLEMAVFAGAKITQPNVLLPALAALGSGFALQVGVGDWAGLGESQLGFTSIAEYPTARPADLLVGAVVAALTAIVALASHRLGGRVAGLAKANPKLVLLVSGAAIGLLAWLVRLWTGADVAWVLFAGQSSMTDYLGVSAVGIGVVLVVAKAIAFAISLGSGFRGGSMFPAVAMGTILAGIGAQLFAAESAPALAAAGIAAGATAAMRMPLAGVVFGTLLTSNAGPATTIPAIIGAIVAMLIVLAIQPAADAAASG